MTTKAARRPAPTPTPPPNILTDPRLFKRIPLSKLRLDADVQRNLNDAHVNKIVRHFRIESLTGAIVAAEENGMHRVVESQHAVEAMRRIADKNDIPHRDVSVPCFVLPVDRSGVIPELEVSRDLIRKPHSALQQWERNLRLGEPPEVLTEAMLAKYGLKVGTNQNPMTIRSASALARIVRRPGTTPSDGVDLLEQTIFVLTSAWSAHDLVSGHSRLDGVLIGTVTEIIRRNPGVDLIRLSDHLGRTPTSGLLKPTSVQPVGEFIAAKVIASYNSRLSTARKLTW